MQQIQLSPAGPKAIEAKDAPGDLGNGTATLVPLKSQLKLCAFKKDNLPKAAFPILSLFLRKGKEQEKFFSFTEIGDEISLVVDEAAFSLLGKELQIDVNENLWIPLMVQGEGSLVGSIAKELADQQISLYYLGTYNSDYCLTKRADVNSAISCLTSRLGLLFDETTS